MYNRGTNVFKLASISFRCHVRADWGLCIVGSCNLILYIGYILYIVKSLCDINGYVFTIERGRRTGHRRVPRAIGRYDSGTCHGFPWSRIAANAAAPRFSVVASTTGHVCSSRVSVSRHRSNSLLSRMYITLNFAFVSPSFVLFPR